MAGLDRNLHPIQHFPDDFGIVMTRRADSAKDISAIEMTERARDGGRDG